MIDFFFSELNKIIKITDQEIRAHFGEIINIHKMKKGTLLLSEGDASKRVFFMCKGLARAFYTNNGVELCAAPEIKPRDFLPQSSNNFSSLTEVSVTGLMEPPNRAFINNAWWNNADVPLFYWDSPNKSSTALFHFLEIDDTGTSNTFTIGLGVKFKTKISGVETEVGPNLGYSITWKATDKEIGRFPIEQFICPPIVSDNCYQLGTAFQFKTSN